MKEQDATQRAELLTLCALVTAGCALRLTGLETHSLWFDEGAMLASALADDPVAVLRMDRHAPVSFYLLRYWMRWFGESDTAIHLPSALSSSFTLVLFAWLSRAWASSRARVAAVALFAVAPFQLWHGQEARPYALLQLAAMLALCGVQVWRSGRIVGGCVLAALGQALALGTHYMGGMLLFGIAALAAVAWRAREASLRRAIALVASASFGAALWLPWLIAVLPDQRRTLWGYILHITPIELAKLPVAQILIEHESIPTAWHWAFFALAGLLLCGFLASTFDTLVRYQPRKGLIALAFFAPVLAGLAAALGFNGGFQAKYLIVAAPGATWMAIEGLALLPNALVRRGVLAVTVAGCLAISLAHRSGNHREDFRGACAEVEASWREGDRLMCLTGTPDMFGWPVPRHYLRGRPDILASMLSDEHLAETLDQLAPGTRLHVVFRVAPYSQPHMNAIERRMQLVERGERRVRVEHSLWLAPANAVSPK